MIRSDVLKTLIPLISDQLLVTNIGLPSQEMHLLDDQPSNFYMLGTMGLASSIGLGLALAQDKKVIALDGDGCQCELAAGFIVTIPLDPDFFEISLTE